MRKFLNVLPALLLTTCPMRESERDSAIAEAIAKHRVEYSQKVSEMLGAEGIKSLPLQNDDMTGGPSTITIEKNNFVASGTYRAQQLITNQLRPEDKEKVLLVPSESDECLIIDGKSETMLEVIYACHDKLTPSVHQ